MKKSLLIPFMFSLITTYTYAIPDITLYMDKEPFITIQNNKLYDEENELFGEIQNDDIILAEPEDGTIYKIQEDKQFINIFCYDMSNSPIILTSYSFSKKNGFLVMTQEGVENKHANTELYYEDTGLLRRKTYYNHLDDFIYSTEYIYDNAQRLIKEIDYDEYDKIESTTEYSFYLDTKKIIKETIYDSNNELDYYYIYSYNQNYEKILVKDEYDKNDFLTKSTKYDANTNKIHYISEYYDNQLKSKVVYDTKTGEKIEKLIYTNEHSEPEKWEYLDFDSEYEIDERFFLCKDFCSYWDLKYNYDEIVEDWNKYYSAKIKKINYNNLYEGWNSLQELEKRFLFQNSITLGKVNSSTFYCFTYTDEGHIDFNDAYEVQLTKKEINWVEFNKSGKGSGPFGIDIGMTYEEVKEACNGNEPEFISDNRYFIKPKKTHPLFQNYIAWICPKYGVYYIKAYSSPITTSEYGTEVKNKFKNLINILEKKYGTVTITDYVRPDYRWQEDKDWLLSLKDGARTYQGIWHPELIKEDDYDGLDDIHTGIDVENKYDENHAYIWIEYKFKNYEDAYDLLNDAL